MKGKDFNNLDSLKEIIKSYQRSISNQTIMKKVDDANKR